MPRGVKTKPEVIRTWIDQIVPILQRGTAFKNACAYLKIPHSTFWDYVQNDAGIRAQIAAAENYLDILAETKIADSIKEGNTTDAKWRVERSQKKKYSQLNQFSGQDGGPIEVTLQSVLRKYHESNGKDKS